MANQEHLWMLSNGPEYWNRWRHENPQIRPILLGWDDPGVEFNNAVLKSSDMRGASLHGSDLSGCDLSGADLSGADLSGADLSGGRSRVG